MLKRKNFFDWIIFKNAFLRSIKYIWNIVFIVIFSSVILFIFVWFAPSVRERENLPLFYSMFGMFWLFLLLTFDSTDLANIFIEDRNRGLLNMELRKGRNSIQIMISRFIANKVITLTMSIIVLLSLIIFLAIIQPRELNNLPLIIFLILPLEFLGVGLFLIFFSFGWNKTAQFVFQVYFSLFSWMCFQPANWMLLAAIGQTNSNSLSPFVVETMRAALIADETLDLAYSSQENELNSFAYHLIDEAYLLDDFLINAENQSFTLNNINKEELETPNRALAFALPLGILNADDVNQLFNDDSIVKIINPNFENSLLYRLNNYVIDNPVLSTSFSNSVYGLAGSSRSNVQYTLNELKKTIEIINAWSDNHNIVGAREFNQLLLRIARTEIGAAGDRNIPIDYSLSPLYHIHHQQTPSMNDYLTQLNLNINDNQINTQVGLKLWNETVMKMLYQASITRLNPIDSLNQTLTLIRTFLYLIPGTMASEIARSPNQHQDPFEKFVAAKTLSGFNFSNYFRGNRFININSNQESFTNVNIYQTEISNTIGMTFSHIGYMIFLFIFSFVWIIISVVIFNKKLKK